MRTREYLEDIRDKDPQTFLGQFQGRPRPPEGAFIQRQWLKEEGSHPRLARVCRFWDLAAESDKRNDFTAGALVGIAQDQTVWLLDVVRFRAEWPDACSLIGKVTEEDHKKFKGISNYCAGVEKVAWQSPMIKDLFRLGIFIQDEKKQTRETVQLWPVRPDRDKKTRASGWVARSAHDRFRMVRDPRWNQEFISECLAFDGLGLTHDDQIDAVSGAYALLWSLSGALAKDDREPKYGTPEWYDWVDKHGLPEEGIYAEDEDE
jgi:predicted phage terminase large subunit-like protein